MVPPNPSSVTTSLRMVTNQREVYSKLGIWKLHITHKTNTTTMTMDGHLSPLGGCSANPRIVTYQPKDGHLVWPCLALFDTIWPGLPMFGPIWQCLVPFGPDGPCLALFDPV